MGGYVPGKAVPIGESNERVAKIPQSFCMASLGSETSCSGRVSELASPVGGLGVATSGAGRGRCVHVYLQVPRAACCEWWTRSTSIKRS